MNASLNTLIAVVIIERGETKDISEVAKRAIRADLGKASVAELLIVLDAERAVTAASMIKGTVTREGRVSFRLSTTVKAPALVGLDFSEVVSSGPNPVRFIEVDVDSRNRLQAVGELSRETLRAAQKAAAPAERFQCTGKALNGSRCKTTVADKGGACVWHQGERCGADFGGARPCQMPVAKAGDSCAYHGGPAVPAKTSKKTKAA